MVSHLRRSGAFVSKILIFLCIFHRFVTLDKLAQISK